MPDGPGRFTQNSSCSALLRIPLCFVSLRIPDCHRLWSVFPGCSSHEISCNSAVLQPHTCRNTYGLGSSPFARHYWGNHCLFSFPAGTKMFQFPALASILDGWYSFRIPGCPIRRFTDQGLFAPPRDFSQLITSFIASESQGIRHAPFFTFLIHSLTLACRRDDIYFKLSYFFICLLHHVIELLFLWRITDSNR